jgi:hypothetical protein
MTDNLYAPLRDDDEFVDTIAVQRAEPMDYIPSWYSPPTFARCTADACSQGRKPCPCPDACRAQSWDEDTSRDMLGRLLLAAGIVGVIAVVVALAVL